MNQKKCPKCGEMNPAEAVMCWACYTPLTGGAVAAGVAGAGAGALAQPHAAAGQDGEEKKAIPPWQIGILAIALLGGLGFGASQLMGGSEEATPIVSTPSSTPKSPGSPPITTPQIGGGGINNTNPVGPSNSGGSQPQPGPAPFKMVASPNPRAQWGVMALLPRDANISNQKAASLAAFAGQKFRKNSSWNAMHVYVFSDPQAAQTFKTHQVPRRQEVLADSDYEQLAAIWPKCLARYEVNGNKESFKYPNRAPDGWWRQ